ncbi:MAG: aminofutalosine synthase MqnE [Euryarchaeota archaeon]|nr:aminofutalosine synthase MqnE [Euryarchaeota archaeon]
MDTSQESYPAPLGGDLNWRNRLSIMPIPTSISNNPTLLRALNSLIEEGRIKPNLGKALYSVTNINSLFTLANMVKQSRFDNQIYFNQNLHVNTTNICVLACRFCAFRKGPRHDEAYELSIDEYLHRIERFSSSIDEVHSVGGLHPVWDITHYEDLYRSAKTKFPHIHIKSLTAVEIKHLSKRSNLTVKETLQRLKNSGLDSIPGGGAEILVDKIRDRICRGKESSNEYLNIHKEAHTLGIPTNCTMLFGTIETIQDRIVHLDLLRQLQDETNGFQCFVPYPFLPDFSRLPEAQLASSNEILRMIAISRLMLDNIPHIKAYRMNIGDDVAQLALLSGADDIDGTVGHEEIMHSAGSTTALDSSNQDLIRLIHETGQIAVRRNTVYSKFNIENVQVTKSTSLPLLV